MTDIQAALGVHQLARVERNWAVRSSYWKLYDEGLDNVPGLVRALAPLPTESRHALHLYTIFVDHHNPELFRTNFVSEMRTRGIGTGVHYLPLHLSYFYRNTYGYRPGDYPEAEWLGSRTVSLPLTAAMTKEDVMRVIMTTIESLAVARRRS
jgi:dTDP-4-amino-4,6-dideoxygalactose transaminase